MGFLKVLLGAAPKLSAETRLGVTEYLMAEWEQQLKFEQQIEDYAATKASCGHLQLFQDNGASGIAMAKAARDLMMMSVQVSRDRRGLTVPIEARECYEAWGSHYLTTAEWSSANAESLAALTRRDVDGYYADEKRARDLYKEQGRALRRAHEAQDKLLKLAVISHKQVREIQAGIRERLNG